jgi:hypothetical protein
VNAILGGWDVSLVSTMQTGPWLTPTISPAFDQSNTGMAVRSGGGAILRPDCGFGNPYQKASDVFFNINAFQPTPANAGRFGNCGIGILEGPGQLNVNSGLSKTVVFRDHYKLRFEATFTNVLNRSNFAPPATNISNPGAFGSWRRSYHKAWAGGAGSCRSVRLLEWKIEWGGGLWLSHKRMGEAAEVAFLMLGDVCPCATPRRSGLNSLQLLSEFES